MAVTPNWRELLARYRVPIVLETVRGKAFTIRADDDDLLVTPHSTGQERRLTQAGFEQAAPLVGGSAHELSMATRNASYVASILADYRGEPIAQTARKPTDRTPPPDDSWDSTVPGEDLEIEAAETEEAERSLADLLDEVRGADRSTRIEWRDALVERGALAIAPMLDWLDECEFAAFAVRVLERIAREDALYRRVVNGLVEARAVAASPSFERDIDDVLGRLGYRMIPGDRLGSSRSGSPGPAGLPGKPGRRYWAMRTSTTNPSFIWSEVRRGHLRQGWGWMIEQDLRRLVELRKAGVPFSPEQQAAWPARRMLETEPDGVRYDDLVVTQNLPRYGHVSVCRVIGPYDFSVPESPEDYGHLLPIELVVEDVSRHDEAVSDALRHGIRLRPRLYEITPYGGDVEGLVTRRGQ